MLLAGVISFIRGQGLFFHDTEDQDELNNVTENLQTLFTSLTQRMNRSELEDFELVRNIVRPQIKLLRPS